MSTNMLMLIVIVVVAAVASIAAWFFFQNRRTKRLRSQFGPEYDREIQNAGNRRHAEATLITREKRVEQLHLAPLMPNDRTRFAESWRNLQVSFVDNPGAAIAAADQLVREVMSKRGYPVAEFEQRAADISVDHPLVVENYRAAHAIALVHAQKPASTEDLRKALIHYRTLFEDLLLEPAELETKLAS